MRGTLPVVLKVLQRLRPHRGLFALAIVQVLLPGAAVRLFARLKY